MGVRQIESTNEYALVRRSCDTYAGCSRGVYSTWSCAGADVCVCACVCVCVKKYHACMYLFMYVFVCVCMYEYALVRRSCDAYAGCSRGVYSTWSCAGADVCVCACVCVCVKNIMHVCIYLCMYLCVYACMSTRLCDALVTRMRDVLEELLHMELRRC